tara:strand:- start:4874 stop:5533 length:660 start_codon:yes stop_codon:yes gene_type:complete
MINYFELPSSTLVNKVIPKNAFDNYTNTRQKKLFTDRVHRITWTNKISSETTNLPFKEVQEIQLFKLELKLKEDINTILEIIDKAIPYPIIFSIYYEDEMYLSTSTKHPHPTNENNAVIDWRFKTDWFKQGTNDYSINLKTDLDWVIKDFSLQISGKSALLKESMATIVQNEQQITVLKKEIEKLKSKISRTRQFNEKVELNLQLKEKEDELKKYNHLL